MFVLFLAKPKLLALTKQVELVPNITYVLQCLEISGTTDFLIFTWTKNGHPLKGSSTVTVVTTESSSLLTLTKLQPTDAANYACSVKNAQGQSDFTSTRLIVKGWHISGYSRC